MKRQGNPHLEPAQLGRFTKMQLATVVLHNFADNSKPETVAESGLIHPHPAL